jgi:hypothetical protein
MRLVLVDPPSGWEATVKPAGPGPKVHELGGAGKAIDVVTVRKLETPSEGTFGFIWKEPPLNPSASELSIGTTGVKQRTGGGVWM